MTMLPRTAVFPCASYVLLALLSASESAVQSCREIDDSFCVSSGYDVNATFPNVFNQSEGDAQLSMGMLYYLPFLKCSSRIDQFLCSAFYPACNPIFPHSPIEPCLEFCVQVRDECLPLLRSYGLPWPDLLECDVYFTSIDKNPLCAWLPDLPVPSGNRSNSTNCTPTVLASRRTFVVAWVASWSFVYIGAAVIAVLYVVRTRSSGPIECSVASIVACYGAAAVAYCVSVATARSPPTCVNSAPPPERTALYNGDSTCIVTFGIAYYCTFCTWAWWVALTFQWLVSGLGAKFSRQKRTYVSYHLFCWLVPAPFLAATMARQDLTVDAVMGVCGFKKDNLLAFVIVPLFVALALCCVITLLSHVLLLRRMVRVKRKLGRETEGQVMRAGLFTPLCFAVQGCVLILHSYDLWQTSSSRLHTNIATFTAPVVISLAALVWVSSKIGCRRWNTSATLVLAPCDLPSLPHTDTICNIKETSV